MQLNKRCCGQDMRLITPPQLQGKFLPEFIIYKMYPIKANIIVPLNIKPYALNRLISRRPHDNNSNAITVPAKILEPLRSANEVEISLVNTSNSISLLNEVYKNRDTNNTVIVSTMAN
jgi:hypothetical protein